MLMETNPVQNLEPERKESLNSLAYLLRLFLHYKQAKRKEKIYAWLILCGLMAIGIVLFYLIIVKMNVTITDNQATVRFVVYPGDSIQDTADNVARTIYIVSQKHDKIYQVTISLYMTHSKVHSTLFMGDVTEDAIETRKYRDLASYIKARKEFISTRISSLEYANLLK